MSKRNLILSIICWIILLITVVCWIVTYYGLFSMDLQQSMLYIGFYRIDICDGWSVDDISKHLLESLQRVIHNQQAPIISWFNLVIRRSGTRFIDVVPFGLRANYCVIVGWRCCVYSIACQEKENSITLRVCICPIQRGGIEYV